MIFVDTTAIDAVNEGRDTPDAFYHPKHPSLLIARSKWHNSDGWRGYNVVTPEPGFKSVDEDFATGEWGDAVSDEHGPDAQERKLKRLEAEHGDLFVIYTPTSNVFSTGMDVLAIDREAGPVDKGVVVGHKTRKFTSPDGSWRVRYHATDVVSYNAATGKYKLDTGGWNTMTTAKRMTEFLPSGYYVYRRNWIMYVHCPDDRGDLEIKDGMEV